MFTHVLNDIIVSKFCFEVNVLTFRSFKLIMVQNQRESKYSVISNLAGNFAKLKIAMAV